MSLEADPTKPIYPEDNASGGADNPSRSPTKPKPRSSRPMAPGPPSRHPDPQLNGSPKASQPRDARPTDPRPWTDPLRKLLHPFRDVLDHAAKAARALIDGFGGASEPVKNLSDLPAATEDILTGPYSNITYGVLTALDLGEKLLKKLGALVRKLLGTKVGRMIGMRLFRAGIWCAAATKFSGFYDLIGVFKDNPIGSIPFWRRLSWTVYGAAATIALAELLEPFIGMALMALATAGVPALALAFVFTPLFACITIFLCDYAVKIVGSCLYSTLDPYFRSVLSSPAKVVLSLIFSAFIGIGLGDLFAVGAIALGASSFVVPVAVMAAAVCLGAIAAHMLVSVIGDFCAHYPQGLISRLTHWISSQINSAFAWLGSLFNPPIPDVAGSATPSGRRAPVSFRWRRSRIPRRPRRILAPPTDNTRPWWPPRFFPTSEDDPGDGGEPDQPTARPPRRSPPPPPAPRRPSRVVGNPRPSPVPGGVLFECCDQMLTGIEEIVGAQLDVSTGSLVLFGKPSQSDTPVRISVPAMDLDHLLVALRAAVIGDPMGVSIDPPADVRYGSNRMPPDGTPLLVSYFGQCAGTLAGGIFFEADRIMKCLSVGRDNITRKDFSSRVPGYRSSFHLQADDYSPGMSWHRFWFVIERVDLHHSPDRSEVVFGDVKIALKTELQLHGQTAGATINPLDQQFVDHLTRHYDDYCRDFPVFARLRELAKVAAIASFYANYLGPQELGRLLESEPAPVDTPERTPSIIRSSTRAFGNGTYTHMLSGGVTMAVRPQILREARGEASRLARAATASRPPAATEWGFHDGPAHLRATTLNLRSPERFRPIETDHRFPRDASRSSEFALRRIYTGPADPRTPFGGGWNIFLPYSLVVFFTGGKRREVLDPNDAAAREERYPDVVFLRATETGNAYVYRRIHREHPHASPCWAMVRSQKMSGEKLSFSYDDSTTIRLKGQQFIMRRDRYEYHFDQHGRLVEIYRDGQCTMRYAWNENRITEIEDGRGGRYVPYHDKANDRINRIVTSEGQTLQYVYDADGCLSQVVINNKIKARYEYDSLRRLTEITGANGVVIRRAAYTSSGAAVTGTCHDTLTLRSGELIDRDFDFGRIERLHDRRGTQVRFAYRSTGQLQAITVTDVFKSTWLLQYLADGTLDRVINPLGQIATRKSVSIGKDRRVP